MLIAAFYGVYRSEEKLEAQAAGAKRHPTFFMVFCQRVSVVLRWFPYAAGNRRSGRYYHSKFGIIWE